jgi:hypothetical protein
MNESLRQRLITALQWLTDDMKHRFAADNPDTEGDYSPELKEALGLLELLRRGAE